MHFNFMETSLMHFQMKKIGENIFNLISIFSVQIKLSYISFIIYFKCTYNFTTGNTRVSVYVFVYLKCF